VSYDDDFCKLADALCVNDSLPNFTSLTCNGSFSDRALVHLTNYLSCEGALPSLQNLAIEDKNIVTWAHEKVKAVANIIEAPHSTPV